MYKVMTSMGSRIIERNMCFERYLRDIAKYKILTVEEEIEIFKRIKSGDEKARDIIIESNQRFIISTAKQICRGNSDYLLDLISEGNIGLIIAIDKYEPAHGTRFLTFAVHYIYRQMKLSQDFKKSEIKKTNHSKTVYYIGKINNVFYLKHSRFPTAKELQEILEDEFNIIISNEADLYDLSMQPLETLEDFEMLNYSINDVENKISNDYVKFLCNKGLNTLDKRTRKIIEMYYGINNEYEKNISQIGEELGLTSERIRQLHLSGLDKLKSIIKNGG